VFALLATSCGGGSGGSHAPSGRIVAVHDGPEDATSPAADGGYLAWTSGSKRFAQTATFSGDVYVQRAGASPFRVNPPGTSGITGGIDRGRLVYQQLDRHGSRIRLFDLHTRRFVTLPASIRRLPGIVWKPTLSAPYLLFGRIRGGWDILLTDLRTGRTTLLQRNRAHAGYAVPGQVDGDFAVWTWCSEEACSVWEYSLRTGRRRRLPIGDIYRSGVEGPSVAPDGTVYYGKGGLTCGTDVVLYRYRPGKGATAIASLPRGTDFQYSYAEQVHGGVRLLFDRYDCSRKQFDIAAVLDPS